MMLLNRSHMPALDGATQWINSEPLDPPALRGHTVLVQFWTLSCINWLRTQPYVRAWSQAYQDKGLVIIGVHTPEFSFEHDIHNVRQAVAQRGISYPVAVDSDYTIWRAFGNQYWPALYFIDDNGRIQDHHFGEGHYTESEYLIQQMLGIARYPVSPEGDGVEADADWAHLLTPETYLGFIRTENFEAPNGVVLNAPRVYETPEPLQSKHWALAGTWTVRQEFVQLDQPGGSIACQFLARDAHLVLTRQTLEPIEFRVLLDGEAPGRSHGVDVDADGNGTLDESRLYQLIRTNGTVGERRLQITFSQPGALAYVFTFG
ncbi:redoxin family protein [Streptomyces sp. NPDC048643]|uniref:redoxin family protein n=1 Tax=Streptomyces sp. NPDC048643 TaxID=3155637 RepID=UPI003439912A